MVPHDSKGDLPLLVYFIRPGIVRYDGCFIDTTGGAMDMGTGIFSVAESGIYQLTFTAKYVSSNRGRFGAWSDMYVNQTVSSAKSQFLYIYSLPNKRIY